MCLDLLNLMELQCFFIYKISINFLEFKFKFQQLHANAYDFYSFFVRILSTLNFNLAFKKNIKIIINKIL
jgi:hypothetical protein